MGVTEREREKRERERERERGREKGGLKRGWGGVESEHA